MALSSHHHDEMGPHMKMSVLRSGRPGDEKRAAEVVTRARQLLDKYQDYKTALAAGFEIFMPNLPQPMYHFTNYRYALEAELRFNPEHPTSLLYEKNGAGYKLIGAMYTAPAQFSEDELDQRIPLSVAQWHQHINFCVPPEGRRAEMFAPKPLFGLQGSITAKAECDKAGGTFMPRLFGWMVHVYPSEQTSAKIWSVDRQMHDMMSMPASSSTAPISGAAGIRNSAPTPGLPDASTKAHNVIFKSDDKDISAELFQPAKPGKYPAVVLLYGSGGMNVGGAMFREAAQTLAHMGYVVLLPHYFEKTGTQYATRDDDVRFFASWMKTVADAIEFAGKQPNVDAGRIGLIGYSLGAYLSLSVASLDPQIKAVVEYFGGLPDFFARRFKTMPPTLILHGEADRLVAVKEAYTLETLFKSKRVPYEMKVYPQQGHGFSGEAATDSMQRTVAFFDKNLKN